jgi:hypothetical protein
MSIDGSLLSWPEAKSRLGWAETGILIGNGASMAISPIFGYPSLFDVACDDCQRYRLTPESRKVFAEFDTKNFEEVLFNLRVSRRTCTCFNFPTRDVDRLEANYQIIRDALIAAVRRVHPSPGEIADSTKTALADHLAMYRNVYSTNYDLLVFWSIAGKKYQLDDGSGKPKIREFKDFFWNREGIFDPADTDVWSNTIGIHFLHGGLHLYSHRIDGSTHKHRTLTEPPLGYFENNPDLLPLFVSEGDSTSKMRSIRRNAYLSFAYSRFVRHKGDLVIFGQSLGKQFDGHVADAMRRGQSWTSDDAQASPKRNGRLLSRSIPRMAVKPYGRNSCGFWACWHPIPSTCCSSTR